MITDYYAIRWVFCVVGQNYLPISNLDEGCGLKKKTQGAQRFLTMKSSVPGNQAHMKKVSFFLVAQRQKLVTCDTRTPPEQSDQDLKTDLLKISMLCNMWWECTQWSWGNEVERNKVGIRICMLIQDSTLPSLKMKFHSNLLLSMTLTKVINLVGQMAHWGTSKLSFVSGKTFHWPPTTSN